MTTSTLLLYLATRTLVAITPSPALLCVMSQAASGVHSFRASTGSIWLQRLFGAALIGFGVPLAFSRK